MVTEPTKLEGSIVAITTLGMPSSIGHVLLKQNPKTKVNFQLGPSQRLIILSSRTEKGISEAIDRVKSLPRDDEYLGLVQNVFNENISGHFHRGYAILDTEGPVTFDFQVSIFTTFHAIVLNIKLFECFRKSAKKIVQYGLCLVVWDRSGLEWRQILWKSRALRIVFDDVVNTSNLLVTISSTS